MASSNSNVFGFHVEVNNFGSAQ